MGVTELEDWDEYAVCRAGGEIAPLQRRWMEINERGWGELQSGLVVDVAQRW